MTDQTKEILARSTSYSVWKTKAWEIIMLRDITHPDQKTLGDARAPDLFFGSLGQMEELRYVLEKAIMKLHTERHEHSSPFVLLTRKEHRKLHKRSIDHAKRM